jgi:hypothetical protein
MMFLALKTIPRKNYTDFSKIIKFFKVIYFLFRWILKVKLNNFIIPRPIFLHHSKICIQKTNIKLINKVLFNQI